jgi:hypothetical protein
MYLVVERVRPNRHAWAPVRIAADNLSQAYDEAEKRFKGWKPEAITAFKLYHQDREGNIKLINDFLGHECVNCGEKSGHSADCPVGLGMEV